MFEDPEVMDALVQLALAAMGLAITVATAFLTPVLRRRNIAFIEEKHLKVLHEGAMTWADTALRRGLTEANDEAAAELMAQFKKWAPDAVASLSPSMDFVRKLAQRMLRERMASLDVPIR